MTIGIDANEANVDRRVGSGQYAFEILRHMVQVGREDNFVIYLKDQPRIDFPQPSSNVLYKIFGPAPLWTQIALPLHLRLQNRPDVIFSPAHYAPRFSPVPSVVTIHDLSYLKFPQYFLLKDIKQLKNWTKYSVKQASRIITPSQSAKNDVITYYGYPEENITVVYHGYDASRFYAQQPVQKITQVKHTFGIPGDYILYVGTLQPRKNISRLIEAFASLSQDFPEVKLVIAGKKGWLFETIFARTQQLHMEENVLFTDYVKDEELPYLYAGAKLYVLPSLYEGFGMPLIEAQACGTPVAASHVSSIPEIIGPGFLFDPENTHEIAESIRKVLSMPKGQYTRLKEKSTAHAKQFSWEKAAKETIEVLHSAV